MRRPLLVMGGLFVIGEIACRLLRVNPVYSVAVILTGILIIAISNRNVRTRKRSANLLLFLCLFLGMIWSYGFYYGRGVGETSKLEQAAQLGETLNMTSYISSVDETASGLKLTLKTESERVVMYTDYNEILEPGRYIKLTGKVNMLPERTNPGALDMSEYYAGMGIRYQIKAYGYRVTESDEIGIVTRLYRLRVRLAAVLERLYAGSDAEILKTMMLGDKGGLAKSTKVLYQRSGIAHILAISGLHVAMLAGAVEMILRQLRIRRNVSSLFVIVFIILYGLMTGFSPATLRASLMLCITRVAYLFKRSPDPPTSMMEALLIMVVINPDSIFSSGMLMSFVSVIGVWTGNIMYKAIFNNERFLGIPIRFRKYVKNFLEVLILSISINIWMLPALIGNYYEIPTYSLLLNFIVLPLLSVVIGLGAGSMFIGVCIEKISGGTMLIGVGIENTSVGETRLVSSAINILIYICKLLVFLCSKLLDFYSWLCRLFLRLPGAVIATGHMDTWAMLVTYLVIGLLFVVLWMKFSAKRITKWVSRRGSSCNGVWFRKRSGKSRCDRKSNRRRESKSSWLSKWQEGPTYIYISKLCIYLITCLCMTTSTILLTRICNVSKFRTVFLDVGQGDGCIIHEPTGILSDGRNYIVDCGSTSSEGVGEYTLIPALRYYGMNKLDGIFISHFDEDHISGIQYLLSEADSYGISLGPILMAQGTEESDVKTIGNRSTAAESTTAESTAESTAAESTTDESIASLNTNYDGQSSTSRKIIGLSSGDTVGGHFTVLYPTGQEVIEHSGNEYSLVLLYKWEDKVEILFTGDIGMETEPRVIDKLSEISNDGNQLRENKTIEEKQEGNQSNKGKVGENQSDINQLRLNDESRINHKLKILKCPHHGSKYSSSTELLDSYQPDITVISSGKNNRYGHPHKETIERLKECGCRILNTQENGAVCFEL